MHDRSRCNGSLASAGLALEQVSLPQIIVPPISTDWANEPIRPTQLEQALSACGFRPEAPLESYQRDILIAFFHETLLLGQERRSYTYSDSTE